MQDFIAHPPQAAARTTKANPFELLPRQVEETSLLLAAGQPTAARAAATKVLEAIDRLPERRFTRDAEPQLMAVLCQALLREGRAKEALPVLQKSLALHLAQYDPVRSPFVANARRALAEALRALGDPRAAGAEQEAEEEVRRAQTRATARR